MASNCMTLNDSFEKISVESTKLLLDNKNPRFYGEGLDKDFIDTLDITDARLQEYLRQAIVKKYNIQNLISSIVEIGFLKLDPVITVENGDYYKVVEGNRRIAAIKTIHGELKRKKIEVSDEILKSISEIEIVNLKDVSDESVIWMLQGIRHVSGVRDWGPFQQAELIRTLHVKRGMTYKQVGAIIGLSPARVATIHKGYCGVIQMMEDEKWAQYASPDLFSHFEQAYVRAPIREWLGWDKEKSCFNHKQQLEIFYNWIVNDDPEIPREKLKSKDIRDKLPVVLEHAKAKESLLSNKVDINTAFLMTTKEHTQVNETKKSLDDIESHLIQLKNSLDISEKDKEQLIKIKKLILELVK